MRIGEVTDIVLDENGEVRVTVGVDQRYVVRHSEDPTLITGLFGPDTSIDFIPEQQEKDKPPLDRSVVPPESVLEGHTLTSVNTLITRASEVVPTTQETLNKFNKSMERIEKYLEELTPITKRTLEQSEKTLRRYDELGADVQKQIPALARSNEEFYKLMKNGNEAVPRLEKSFTQAAEDVAATARTFQQAGERFNVFLQKNMDQLDSIVKNLNDVLDGASKIVSPENQRNINRTLNNVAAASDSLEPLAKNANEFLKESRRTLNRFDEVLVSLQQVLKPLSDSGPRIVRNLDEGLEKLNRTFGDVNELIRAVGASNGTLYKILNDPTLYNRIDEAACQLVKLMPRIDRILKDFETFSDKLAKHPELLGVRGAITPSNGLKDPPK